MTLTPRYMWREDEIRALAARGLIKNPESGQWDLRGRVWEVDHNEDYHLIVKSVDTGLNEEICFNYLLKIQLPSNHTVPAEVLNCVKTSLFVMPHLFGPVLGHIWHSSDDRKLLFNWVGQIIEGLAFMHDHNIACIDVDIMNLVYSKPACVVGPFNIPENRVYYIDFGSSRRLPFGPGSGGVIYDYYDAQGRYPPPEGMDTVDPYAYDIYSLGKTLTGLKARTECSPYCQLPESYMMFLETLKNINPAQRPGIRQVQILWHALQEWISFSEQTHYDDPAQAKAADIRGWKEISQRFLYGKSI